jgi:hypothetical protein
MDQIPPKVCPLYIGEASTNIIADILTNTIVVPAPIDNQAYLLLFDYCHFECTAQITDCCRTVSDREVSATVWTKCIGGVVIGVLDL